MALAAAPKLGIAPACNALAVSLASFYRHRLAPKPLTGPQREAPSPHLPPGRALNLQEREAVLTALMSERFMDLAVRQLYAILVEEGTYLC